MGLERKILEELIYERVRVAVDLCELLDFEEDLAASIERALTQCAKSPDERSQLALKYLNRAWERLGHEVLGAGEEATTAPTGAEPTEPG